MPFTSIITHPGGAHKDDFLACAILLADNPVPIERREPLPGELEDSTVAVVDIGMGHDPQRGLFDHHQMDPREHLTCALSLVLQYQGLYQQARRFCAWLETAEWLDCRGPFQTASWLNTDNETMARLVSPIDVTLLRHFAGQQQHGPGEPLWEIMRTIGTDMIAFIQTMENQVARLDAAISIWNLPGPAPEGAVAIFIARESTTSNEPTQGLRYVLEARGLLEATALVISPDGRGEGYGLKRFEDNPICDMSLIADQPDVTFAHQGGFIAKTTATAPDRLRELIHRCITTPVG